MNIPQIDQDLATVKAAEIQYSNGYHLSKNDLNDLAAAMENLITLWETITAERK